LEKRKLANIVNNKKIVDDLYPTSKLMYPVFATISTFLIPNVFYGYFILIVSTIIAYLCGNGKSYLKTTVNILLFLVLFIFLLQAVIAPGEEVIWSWGIVSIKKEGLETSLTLTSRIVAIASSFLLFFQITTVRDISRALEKAGLSPKLSYAIVSVFQFIPEVKNKARRITEAQQSRGIETEGNLKTRAKAFIPILTPLILSSILSTEEKAITLESRGFSVQGRKTSLYGIKKHKQDYIIQYTTLFVLAVLLVWRLFVWRS